MRLVILVVAAAAAACGSGSPAGSGDGGPGGMGGGADASLSGCERAPAAAERDRFIVVSHPYDEQNGPSSSWQLLELSATGVVTATETRFEMGRANGGTVAFTPDGQIGAAAQDDGTVGIFSLTDDGAVTVIDAAYDGDGAFYAGRVVATSDGSGFWVLDSQWRENGGGIYRVDIDCDGQPGSAELVAAGKLPYAMVPAGEGLSLVASADLLDSSAGDDVHGVDLAAATIHSGADAFPDDEQIVSDAQITRDGRHLLIADHNQFYSSDQLANRVAVVAIAGDGSLAPVQMLEPLEDPFALAVSPTNDAALVVSGFGNAFIELDYQPEASEPFTVVGEVSYQGAAPQLPGAAVTVARGSLADLILVAELLGVRQLRFESGSIVDGGLTSLGDGSTAVVGAIGVQP